jgi:ABC-type dipeptide/oligopeptide/nickel transport system permease component
VPDTDLSFWKRFAWGAGGSFAYEVVRLHKLAAPNTSLLISLTTVALYLLLSLALMMAAGIFAAAWQDNKPWKCFYLGVTLPIWIAVWSSHGG